MEFIQGIKTGDTDAFLSRISKFSQNQEDRFQEVLRDLELRFQGLKDFENVVEFDDLKKNVKEPKRKRAAGAERSKLLPNDSICTIDLKEPLCSSTPTETSTASENKENCAKKLIVPLKTNAPIPVTPPNEFKCQIQSESVRKRIEEFEKRAAAGSSSASKIPVLTPVKKNFTVPTTNTNVPFKLIKSENVVEKTKKVTATTQIYVEKTKEVSVVKPRLTRNNSKILQEKTNVKTLKEKPADPPVKKTLAKKVSADETRRKKEENSQQRVVAIKEPSEKPEKQNRDTALKIQQDKEKEAKIRAVHKQKEEKLMMLKKKHFDTVKCPEKKTKKEENILESYNIEDVVDGASTDEEDNPTKKIPSWATKENRKHQLCTQAWMDKKNTVYLWFHNRRLKYPKVDELFSVGVKTRPRTSSAVWNNSSICV